MEGDPASGINIASPAIHHSGVSFSVGNIYDEHLTLFKPQAENTVHNSCIQYVYTLHSITSDLDSKYRCSITSINCRFHQNITMNFEIRGLH